MKYKATRTGSTKVNGKVYHYYKGQTVEGPLGHVGSLIPLTKTKQDIMNELDERGIEYDGRSNKDTLQQLLDDNS